MVLNFSGVALSAPAEKLYNLFKLLTRFCYYIIDSVIICLPLTISLFQLKIYETENFFENRLSG